MATVLANFTLYSASTALTLAIVKLFVGASIVTSPGFLQPCCAAIFVMPIVVAPPEPISKEMGELRSAGDAATGRPNHAVLPFSSTGVMRSPVIVNEPTTATTPAAAALRPHVAV